LLNRLYYYRIYFVGQILPADFLKRLKAIFKESDHGWTFTLGRN